MDNALTIDVEEWFHVCGVEGRSHAFHPSHVLRNVDRLLECFAALGVTATFFVLGSVAEALPTLVPAIAAAGHEVASHGFSHTLITALSPAAFRDELRRTNDILAIQAGRRPIGFRAPQWSLSHTLTPWAFEILHDEGFRYDSSCNPLPFVGDRSGSRVPYKIEMAGRSLWEIPPMVTPTILGNLPTGGGWGFRFFPQRMIERTVVRFNEEGRSAVFYLHPREIDPNGPRLPLSLFRQFVAYGPRTDALERLVPILRRFRFAPLSSLVNQWESA